MAVPTREDCAQIHVIDLQKKLKKLFYKDNEDGTIEQLYEFTNKNLNEIAIDGQRFKYISQVNYLGGHRWFFKCNKCDKRVSKLYKPPIESNKTQLYLCSTCHNLKNRSTVYSQNTLYAKVNKPIKRLREIEARIAKGHMKMFKVQELMDEYDKIETSLKNMPEYRLWIFKKSHNLLTRHFDI